jgi:hypothetical protein
MRQDENGNPCPETLNEYLSLCVALGGKNCKAVHFLNAKIADSGPDEKVIAPDSQMRMLLMPMLVQPAP